MRRAAWLVPIVFLLLLAIALLAGDFFRDTGPAKPERPLIVPEFSPLARRGAAAFVRQCAECHGSNAAGSPKGPPLVHPVYRAAHHADFVFSMAVRQGVPQHHWRFGDMPRTPATTASDVDAIVRYVRELQDANGIR